MSEHDFEKLIQEAYGERIASGLLSRDTSKCLDNETLLGLYRGSLTESAHQSAIEHLGECELCCLDMAFCFEFMNATDNRRSMSKHPKDS